MGSKPRIATQTASPRRLIKRTPGSSRRPSSPPRRDARIGGGASVSDKLEALKSLAPSDNVEMKTEELFRETANYIVRLKTQVFVLQKLIDFYGSQPQDCRNAAW